MCAARSAARTAAAAPRYPVLAGYAELAAGLRELGLQHAGDLVHPEDLRRHGAGGFRILDGLRYHTGTGRASWRLVDGPRVARLRTEAEQRFPGREQLALRMFDLLGTAMAQDVMVLRHVVLYQLLDILGGRRGTLRDRHAEQLGVAGVEASAVISLVGAVAPFDPAARAAAESLPDLLASGRPAAAARLAAQLPDEHEDGRLKRLCAALQDRCAAVERLLAEAEDLIATGRPAQAQDCFLRAAAELPDDPRPRTGLFALALRKTGPVSAAGRGSDVRVRWAAPSRVDPGPAPVYELWRLPDGDPAAAVSLGISPSGWLADPGVAFGESVSYLVLPLREGKVAGAPVASPTFLHVPYVRSIRLVSTPTGIRGRWQAPVELVRVTRFGPGESTGVDLPAEPGGFDDPGCGLGIYRYSVSCSYPGPEGAQAWSPEWTGTIEHVHWPSPVDILDVTALDPDAAAGPAARRLQVRWRPSDDGDSRLIVWPYTARARGEDVSALLDRLPASLPDAPLPQAPAETDGAPVRLTEVSARPGRTLRLTGVSVFDGRAVIGDSVLITEPARTQTADQLSLRRLDEHSAQAAFPWPEPTVLVRLTVDQDGSAPQDLVLARSSARGRPVSFPAGRGALRVTVEPLARPDADLAFFDLLTAELPALPPAPTLPVARRAEPHRPAPARSPVEFTAFETMPQPVPPRIGRIRRWWRALLRAFGSLGGRIRPRRR